MFTLGQLMHGAGAERRPRQILTGGQLQYGASQPRMGARLMRPSAQQTLIYGRRQLCSAVQGCNDLY